MILGLGGNCCRRKTSDATAALCARHNAIIGRIRGSFHISAYEICGSFTLFYRDHVTCEAVMARANDEASLSSAGQRGPLRRTLPVREVSLTPSSELEPARMEKHDQSTPSFTDARDHHQHQQRLIQKMWQSRPSCFVEPPIGFDVSSNLDVPTE